MQESDRELVKAWLEDGKAPTTVKHYTMRVDHLDQWMQENNVQSLAKIKLSDLDSFLEDHFSKRVNSGTAQRNLMISAIRSLFKYGYSMGFLKANPAAALQPLPTTRTSRYAIVTASQISRAISYPGWFAKPTDNYLARSLDGSFAKRPDSHQAKSFSGKSSGSAPQSSAPDLLALSFGTGAKMNELLRLKGKHRVQYGVDFKPTSHSESPPLILAMERKSRHIACSASMQKHLSQHVLTCGPEEYLIKGTDGKPLHYSQAYAFIRNALTWLKVEYTSPNIVRLSAAVHMRRRGATYEYIANQLGCSPEYVVESIAAICPRLHPWFDTANHM